MSVISLVAGAFVLGHFCAWISVLFSVSVLRYLLVLAPKDAPPPATGAYRPTENDVHPMPRLGRREGSEF